MKISEILNSESFAKAPDAGWTLAYYRKKVVFEKYESKEKLVKKISLLGDLLELRLFDESSEYRVISSESKRFPLGYIEHFCDFPNDPECVYKENVNLESGGTISVLNHLSFEGGTAFVDDVRLKM